MDDFYDRDVDDCKWQEAKLESDWEREMRKYELDFPDAEEWDGNLTNKENSAIM